jgi:hypothetical protein
MKRSTKLFAFAFGLWLCMAFAGSPAPGASIPRPVVYSYYWPISKGQKDLIKWNMETPAFIDVPPQDSPKWLEAKAYWEKRGKTVLSRVYPFKRIMTEDEMYGLFAKNLEKSKGIAIDEIVAGHLTQGQAIMFVNAMKRIRRAYPDSIIAVWCGGTWDSGNAFVLEAIRDYADMFLPELYISQTGANKKGFGKFKSYLTSVETLAPGIMGKTLVGVGLHPRMANDPSQSFRDHLSAQITLLGTDPFFRGILGIALYAPVYLPAGDQEWIDGVLKKYFGR